MSLGDLVAPLNVVLFHFGQDAVTWAELLGFLTGAVGVWLTVRANIWNFPIGLANNIAFLVLFGYSRLYADASLQIVYFVLGIYGWLNWLPSYLMRVKGLDLKGMALAASLPFAFGAIGCMTSGWVSDRWFRGRRKVLVLACQVLDHRLLQDHRVAREGPLPEATRPRPCQLDMARRDEDDARPLADLRALRRRRLAQNLVPCRLMRRGRASPRPAPSPRRS